MYSVRQVTQADEWSQLFEHIEHPHLSQAWAYGEAKKTEGWHPRRVAIERGGQPVALCQLLDKGLLLSRISRGPLLLRDDDPDILGIYSSLRRRRLLLIAPALNDGEQHRQLLRAAWFCRWRRNGWSSGYLNLRLSEHDLRKNLTSSWRRQLSASERSLTLHVSTNETEVAWIIDRHMHYMKQKGFHGPKSPLLWALYQAAREDFLVFKALLDHAPVGGLVVFRFGNTAESFVAWFGPEGRKVNVGNFLMWNAAIEMQRRGCRYFDLGSYSKTDAGGYHKFKRAMNGVDYCLLGEWFSVW